MPDFLRRQQSCPDLRELQREPVVAPNQTDAIPGSNQAMIELIAQQQAQQQAQQEGHAANLLAARAGQTEMLPNAYGEQADLPQVLHRGRMLGELQDQTAGRRRPLDRAGRKRAEGESTDISVLPDAYDAMGLQGDEKDDLNTMIWGTEQAALRTQNYHATRKKNVGSILGAGLDPTFGGSGAAKSDKGMEKQSEGKVHYTQSLAHAGDYKDFFEKGKMPTNKDLKTKKSKAEILKIALPRDIRDGQCKDQDDPLGWTVSEKISPDLIRGTSLPPIPDHNNNKNNAPERQLPWMEHQQKGDAELLALYSNMDEHTRRMVDQYPVEQRHTVLRMLKQAMGSKKGTLTRKDHNVWE